MPLINKYNYQRIAYYNKYGTFELYDGDDAAQADYSAILDQYNNQLVPALKNAVGFLKQLEQYSLHGLVLMALNCQPETSTISGFKGPFRLNIFFFLGAKATNTYTLDFYVKDTGHIQNVMIKIVPDILNSSPLQWKKGGISFAAVDQYNQPCNQSCQLGFLTMRSSQQTIAPESALYNWWDSMIVSDSDNACGLTQYLLPFDMYKLQKELQTQNQAQNSALSNAAVNAIGTLTQFFGKKETLQQLLDPKNTGTSFVTSTTQYSASGDIFSLLSNLSNLIPSQNTSYSATNTVQQDPSILNYHTIPDL